MLSLGQSGAGVCQHGVRCDTGHLMARVLCSKGTSAGRRLRHAKIGPPLLPGARLTGSDSGWRPCAHGTEHKGSTRPTLQGHKLNYPAALTAGRAGSFLVTKLKNTSTQVSPWAKHIHQVQKGSVCLYLLKKKKVIFEYFFGSVINTCYSSSVFPDSQSSQFRINSHYSS